MVLLPASRERILAVLTAIVVAFALLHLGAVLVEYATADEDYFQRLHLGEIRRQINLEQENNLTTWYASATLLFSAMLLKTIARARGAERDRFAGHWTGLACAFVYLSIDETAMLHEATIAPLQRLFHPTGVFYFAWVILALPILVIFLLAYLRFIAALPPRTRIAFLAAGAVFVSGGVGLEMVEGVIETERGGGSLMMVIARSSEEIMEMIGVLLFIRALFEVIGSLPRASASLDAI